MSDRSARADPFNQQPPAVHGQAGITVGHEDLRCGAVLDSSTTPEVFAVIKTPQMSTTLVINT
ncbi:hypothetical protein, partial [Streptomyces sp. NPDC088733]|uniref:hypothetical protein n=1 Tax=Streptomyces sp. NPDC088733 TaxID=3365880 RepID=UPI0038214A5B